MTYDNILEAIKANVDLAILGEPRVTDYLDRPQGFNGSTAQEILIVVAPKETLLSRKLISDHYEKLVGSLMPGQYYAPMLGESTITFGHFRMVEPVGKLTLSGVVSLDQQVGGPQIKVSNSGKLAEERRVLQRATQIKFYPCREVAEFVRRETAGTFSGLGSMRQADVERLAGHVFRS